jgi:hypothetical protein
MIAKHLLKLHDIELVASGTELREVRQREVKQPHGGMQSASVFWMCRPQKLFLQMHERARRLNQRFEIIRVVSVGAQPQMLENIVRFVVTLFIPASKKTGVTGMMRNIARSDVRHLAGQFLHKLRNPLAFGHRALNLTAAAMTGKPAGDIFPEDRRMGRVCRREE